MKTKKSHIKQEKLKNDNKELEGFTAVKQSKPNKKNYINPKEFKDEIVKFYKTGIMTTSLAQSVYDIAKRLSFAPNFVNYSYKEEMIGDAIIKMIAALRNKKFNPDYPKSNPFSYFTRISYNAYRNRIKKEKKAHEVLLEYQNEVFNTLSDEGYITNRHQAPETTDDSEYTESMSQDD